MPELLLPPLWLLESGCEDLKGHIFPHTHFCMAHFWLRSHSWLAAMFPSFLVWGPRERPGACELAGETSCIWVCHGFSLAMREAMRFWRQPFSREVELSHKWRWPPFNFWVEFNDRFNIRLQNLYEARKLHNLGQANFLTPISESSIPLLGSRWLMHPDYYVLLCVERGKACFLFCCLQLRGWNSEP